MSGANPSRSSATLVSVVVTMLGALIIRLAGFSHGLLSLGLFVLLLGLASTVVALLRSSRVANRDHIATPRKEPTVAAAPLRESEKKSETLPVETGSVTILNQLAESFEGWWRSSAETQNVWLSFDRWLRDTLHELAGGRRIRCFRVSAPDHRLVSLADDLDDPVWAGASWRGLVDHVVESGRMYAQGAGESGELVEKVRNVQADPAGAEQEPAPQWLVPMRRGAQIIGLIVAGEIGGGAWDTVEFLHAVARMFSLMWVQVELQTELRTALQTDRASGVLNRTDLTLQAEKVLADAAADEEPVVLLAVAIEGIRRLDDGRHWELQDWLMQQVGRAMHRRLRTDDIIGRFSDDRFVAVLRRLDLSLGELIARKVFASLQDAIQHGDAPLTDSVRVRCGLAADTRAGFETLLSRACDALHDARDRGVGVAAYGSSKHPVEISVGAAP